MGKLGGYSSAKAKRYTKKNQNPTKKKTSFKAKNLWDITQYGDLSLLWKETVEDLTTQAFNEEDWLQTKILSLDYLHIELTKSPSYWVKALAVEWKRWGCTFNSADLGHKSPHISHRQPICQSLAPHQSILINHTVSPTLPENMKIARPTCHHQSVLIIPILTRFIIQSSIKQTWSN